MSETNKKELLELCNDILDDTIDCIQITFKCFNQGYDKDINIVSYRGENNAIYSPSLIENIAKSIKDFDKIKG